MERTEEDMKVFLWFGLVFVCFSIPWLAPKLINSCVQTQITTSGQSDACCFCDSTPLAVLCFLPEPSLPFCGFN